MTDLTSAFAIPLTDQLSPDVCRPQRPAHRQRGGGTRESRLPGSSVLRLRLPAQGLAVRYVPAARPAHRGRAVPALASACPWARALGLSVPFCKRQASESAWPFGVVLHFKEKGVKSTAGPSTHVPSGQQEPKIQTGLGAAESRSVPRVPAGAH